MSRKKMIVRHACVNKKSVLITVYRAQVLAMLWPIEMASAYAAIVQVYKTTTGRTTTMMTLVQLHRLPTTNSTRSVSFNAHLNTSVTMLFQLKLNLILVLNLISLTDDAAITMFR